MGLIGQMGGAGLRASALTLFQRRWLGWGQWADGLFCEAFAVPFVGECGSEGGGEGFVGVFVKEGGEVIGGCEGAGVGVDEVGGEHEGGVGCYFGDVVAGGHPVVPSGGCEVSVGGEGGPVAVVEIGRASCRERV